MSTTAVKQSLAFYAHAIDAVDLSKRAALQTARSWSGIAEAALPVGRPGPWTLVDAGLDSAESFMTAQTSYAKSILDATAAALGLSATKSAPPVAAANAIAEAVEPIIETAAVPAPRTPKPPVTGSKAPSKAGRGAKGASRRPPAAG